MSTPLLQVSDLNVTFPSEAGQVHAVRGVSFELKPNHTLSIVGESGSGKSVTSLAIMGLLSDSAKVTGSVTLNGTELLDLNDEQMSKHRGSDIGMIFQDPLSALTPVYSVGSQVVEALQVHQKISKKAAWKRAVELLDLVGIPNAPERAKSFPHEFSGGMRQRVVIAIAIANNPKIIIADEPTTALDVTIQAQILELLKTIQQETQAAIILVTHDMGVVANMADDVLVMYAGRPVEYATVDELFSAPRMPYTIGLLSAIPRPDVTAQEPLIPIKGNPPRSINLADTCPFAPRCPVAVPACSDGEPSLTPVLSEIASSGLHVAACLRSDEIHHRQIDGKSLFSRPPAPVDTMADTPRDQRDIVLEVDDLTKHFPLMKGALLKRRVGTVYALNKVSFDLRKGETLAIVGESGSGKTTALLEIMELGATSTAGSLKLLNKNASDFTRRQRRFARKNIQMVFQDPMGALDPRLTVFELIAEPLRAFHYEGDLDARVSELLSLVGLSADQQDRFPGDFSGGQRQRIGVARALASRPQVIVLDEPVSALDVSIQADIINLLDELRAKLSLSYVFVAHDLSVVRHISHRIAVMYLGRFVEYGDTEKVFKNPQHPYTQALLSAVPVPDPSVERNRKRVLLSGELPSPTAVPEACSFRARCPRYRDLTPHEQDLCVSKIPLLDGGTDTEHSAACHFRELASTTPL